MRPPLRFCLAALLLGPSSIGCGGLGGACPVEGRGADATWTQFPQHPRALKRARDNRVREAMQEHGLSDADIRAYVGVARAEGPPETCKTKSIKATVQRGAADIRRCYEAALREDPSTSGKIFVKWEFGEEGSVERARVEQSTLCNQSLERCMVRAVGEWRFDGPRGGRCVVNWPFVLQAGR